MSAYQSLCACGNRPPPGKTICQECNEGIARIAATLRGEIPLEITVHPQEDILLSGLDRKEI